MAHPSDLPPLHPPAPPDPSNGDWTTNLPEPILSNQPPSNNASTATLDQTNTISSIGNEDAGINTYTNNQNKQYLLPNPTYSAPSQLKISSNFDRPQHRKEQISDKTIVDHQKPPHITGTQPISPPNTQTLVPSKMEMVILTNTFNRGNRQHDPPSNKRNDQVVSKPSFAATVQAQLSASSGAPLVNIEYGTHLGKLAIFFSAQDYFINLAQECRFTIIGKFYRNKPTMEEIRKVFVRQFHLTSLLKIAYFDPKHVYIDFTNEVEYNHILFKEYVDIGESPMKILKWTADFKPEEETTIVPCGF